jgi:hypothetical protein
LRGLELENRESAWGDSVSNSEIVREGFGWALSRACWFFAFKEASASIFDLKIDVFKILARALLTSSPGLFGKSD